MKLKNPLPRTRNGWLVEIAAAYREAASPVPFRRGIGEAVDEAELFHSLPSWRSSSAASAGRLDWWTGQRTQR